MIKRKGTMLLLAVAGLILAVGTTQAATMDSINFAYKYEADALPGTDWTVNATAGMAFSAANGELSYSTPNAADNLYIDSLNNPATSFNPTTADDYTVEARFKVTNAASDFPGTHIIVGNGNRYGFFTVSQASISLFNGAGHAFIATGLDNADMHTYRIAFSAAANRFSLWRDGTLISEDLVGTAAAVTRVAFGDASGSTAGAASLDYLRFDTTGAYAPVVPEPATLSLLAIGAVALRRRK